MLKDKLSPATCGRDSAQGAESELTAIIGYIKKAVCKSKKLITFAANYILRGGRICLYVAGIFYALSQTIYGSVPPCNSVMELLPLRCSSTGKAEPLSIFAEQINLSVMNYTDRQSPATCRHDSAQGAESDRRTSIGGSGDE